jgi:hypothetical protein
MRQVLILPALLWLSACVGVASERPQPVPGEAPRVSLKVYPPALQTRVADELTALPEGSALAGLVIDYGQLRRAVCAAEGWKQPACRIIRQAEGKS